MTDRNSNKSDKYNSNKSTIYKKNIKDKKDNHTQSHIQSDFLSNKRNRLKIDNNISIFCTEKLPLEDQIFSSKNVVSSSKLFDKELTKSNGVTIDNGKKKNQKKIENFFTTVTNTSVSSVCNNNLSVNSDQKISNFLVKYFLILGRN